MNRYLVTGCFGFIGQHLCNELVAKGAIVTGIGHCSSLSQLETQNEKFKVYNADVQFSELKKIYENAEDFPEVVFHLAGGASVGAAIENPKRDFERTVGSTLELLEWIRLHSPKAQLIIVSSAAVYGAQRPGPINEGAHVNPYSLYGYNKYMMETLSRSYAEEYGITVKVARLFSVYGELLQKQLLWDLCKKIQYSSNNCIELGGTGNELRDWIHVTDVVTSLIKLSQSAISLINIASGVSSSVKDIASIVLDAWFDSCNHPAIAFNGKVRKGDPFSLIADVSLMENQLGVQCKKVHVGISEYVKWFKTMAIDI